MSKNEEEIKEFIQKSSQKESDEFTDVKKIFPFLKDINEDNPGLILFVSLIRNFQNINQKIEFHEKKYELMYKIIQVGNCVEYMFGNDFKNNESKKVLEECENKEINLSDTPYKTQIAFFKYARNISADYFHLLYKSKTDDFLNHFTRLCTKGRANSKEFVEINNDIYKYTKGTNVGTFFSRGGKAVMEKWINQTLYFSDKCDDFMKNNDYNSANMAIIAMRNCGRSYNFSGKNPNSENSIFATMGNIRGKVSHMDNTIDNDNKYVLEFDSKETKKELLKEFNETNYYKDNDFSLDLEKYTEKEGKESSESPRAIGKNLL
jgi:hypothetical protein